MLIALVKWLGGPDLDAHSVVFPGSRLFASLPEVNWRY